jgi:DNA topoisomerase-1
MSTPTPLLRYVSAGEPGWSRRRRGRGFEYRDARQRPVRDAESLARIRGLAIPPAWSEVWICASPRGHIQATGRDARGRKQYRYHAAFRARRDADKFGRLAEFGAALPRLRRRVRADLRAEGLTRERVLAAVVALLDRTRARIGNDEYARDNRSYGLTTLHDSHATIDRRNVRLAFRGKSGGEHRLEVSDAALANVIRRCQELPGQRLFQFLDDAGRRRQIGSGDVNRYLRESAGIECSAKDFRTWHGSVMALDALRRLTPAERPERQVVQVVADVAKRLGNTRAVCRRYYIAPLVVEEFLAGHLDPDEPPPGPARGLNQGERRLLALLRTGGGPGTVPAQVKAA